MVQRCLCLFAVLLFPLIFPFLLLTKYCNVAEAAAVTIGCLLALTVLPTFLVIYSEIWCQHNVLEMAKENSFDAVGSLLDMADSHFLGKYKLASEPESHFEKSVFTYLPALLDRMSSGDGPNLSARQQETLRRLLVSPRYRPRFALPGLEAKIDAMVSSGEKVARP